MDFLEHDLKTLLDEMREPFLPSEIKTLLLQIISGVEFLHSHWIMHRDLKTSNLLMNNRGEIKIADFGMARYYGDPPPKLTQLVVTLWYRAPELLLGADKYGTEIDMWSIGCIFGELLIKEPLLQGKNEVDQVSKVCNTYNIPTSAQLLYEIPPKANDIMIHKDFRLDRPPNRPNLAILPLSPKRKIPPSSTWYFYHVRDTRKPTVTPPVQIPLSHKLRPEPALFATSSESKLAADCPGMPFTCVFSGRPSSQTKGDVSYFPF